MKPSPDIDVTDRDCTEWWWRAFQKAVLAEEGREKPPPTDYERFRDSSPENRRLLKQEERILDGGIALAREAKKLRSVLLEALIELQHLSVGFSKNTKDPCEAAALYILSLPISVKLLKTTTPQGTKKGNNIPRRKKKK
jgi:hypothetical protein